MAAGVLIAGVAPAQPLLPTAVTDFNVNNGAIGGRTNLALASEGATAFASSELTPSFGPALLNDGLFNSSGAYCWIAATAADGEYAGIAFAGPVTLSSIGFGGHDGWTGRSAGTWSLQYTTEASPGTGTTAWTQIGTYTWTLWDSMPRILFEFPAIANVTGIRLVNSNNTFASSVMQVGIQELEAYSPPVAPALIPTAVGDMALSGAPFEMSVSAKLGGRTNLALASGGSTAFAVRPSAAPMDRVW